MTKLICCLLFLWTMSALCNAEECAELAERVAQLDLSKAAAVRANDHMTFSDLYKECDTRNTFGGRPLPTFKGTPLKCSEDPNRVSSRSSA